MHSLSPSRRQLLAGVAAFTSATAATTLAHAQTRDTYKPPAVPMKDGAADISPDEALALLREGNNAFVEDRVAIPDISQARRDALAEGQAPFCAVVACSDSRVPPEILFGRGLGDLFIIRNAGNTVDAVARGSVEYAVAILKVPLVVVMGHEACGAVKAALSVVDKKIYLPGDIEHVVEPILPAVLAVRDQAGDPTENAVRENVRHVAHQLRTNSEPMLRDPVQAGALKVVGAYYHFDGTVEFIDEG